ncbi:hypothetical protein GQ457_05G009410 [Hibiscus cannabinus]
MEGEAHRPVPKREMELQHFAHPHPLLFIQHQGKEALCLGCRKPIEGSSYCCSSCRFHLHETCAKLELAPEIRHPSHPLHPLVFLPQSPYPQRSSCRCNLCHRVFEGFVYHCAPCSFDLDISCASLTPEINHPFHPSHPLVFLIESPDPQGYYVCNFCHGPRWEPLYHCASCNFSLDINCASCHLSNPLDFPQQVHFSHEHKLMFIEKHDGDVPAFCFGCDKRLSGPTYRCLECSNFDLHQQCAETVKQIDNHFLHRQHTVSILVDPPIHPETCTCDVCERGYQGFVYHCSSCNFTLPFKDFFRQTMVHAGVHEHPLILLQRRIPFICDLCGVSGDRDPYICGTCQILLHERCISLPKKIKAVWHQHILVHRYSLRVDKHNRWDCGICYNEIDPQYGSYSCSACSYTVHVSCVLGKTTIRDGDEPIESGWSSVEESPEGKKHVYHEHILVLTDNGEAKGDNVCDGCMKPVSKSFYSCEPCGFFLHEDCAMLPRQNRLPNHKHLLTLTKNGFTRCDTCSHYHHGFSYKCDRRRYKNFKIDLHCALQPPALRHPSHDHKLFLDENHVGNYSGCDNHISRALPNGSYRCEPCGYVLDFKCIRLPHTAWYKYDKHDLTLTYHDHSDPSQRYCDMCEEERQPNSLYYYCEQCDNSIHIDCIIGDLPFVKLGSSIRHEGHPHSLTLVKKIWNCPPCKVCGKICNTQALECKEPECNFIVHWKCPGLQEKILQGSENSRDGYEEK